MGHQSPNYTVPNPEERKPRYCTVSMNKGPKKNISLILLVHPEFKVECFKFLAGIDDYNGVQISVIYTSLSY